VKTLMIGGLIFNFTPLELQLHEKCEFTKEMY